MKPDEILCPNCGKLMEADLHAPEDGAEWEPNPPDSSTGELREMDNWICHNCWTVLTRKDDYIRENLDEAFINPQV